MVEVNMFLFIYLFFFFFRAPENCLNPETFIEKAGPVENKKKYFSFFDSKNLYFNLRIVIIIISQFINE